ncbi:MAG: type IV secretion system DNA-binding domain-containing protein [Betaproteobacteria bacterium]|nr:type IV secretion system DNA-binding domain-containing protein [Betaproteobacteria bacterium]
MSKKDIRADRSDVRIKHESARGTVKRNSGSFTRGSNLISHQVLMFLGGAKWPFYIFAGLFLAIFVVLRYVEMNPYDLRLVFTKWMYDIAMIGGLDPAKPYDIITNRGTYYPVTAGTIAYNWEVILALKRFWHMFFSSLALSTLITAFISFFYVAYANKRGDDLLTDYHKRGAVLVDAAELKNSILAQNLEKMRARAKQLFPNKTYDDVTRMPMAMLNDAGFHIPYKIAGIQFPYGFEQTHTMLIGTTGTGKTVVFSDILDQLRTRNHCAVVFDLTGVFVERFYDPARDFILNPFDKRCPSWSFFHDAKTEPEIKSAAMALIPDVNEGSDPFWQLAARTLFTEMCLKLIEEGRATNEALIEELMTADLKSIHSKLRETIADPLTSPEAARMAESIRAVFNANADILQSLPDDGEEFSIRNWITHPQKGEDQAKGGSILFISSSYTQIAMTQALITLWINTALYSLMSCPRTQTLKMWFLIDELGALHQLPALEHGLQTARNQGGAIMLGVHGFPKLSKTYGENGAKNIIGLANNKLFFRVPEDETADKCSKLIGNREVREVDESYSISNNNNRDTSTISARTQIEPLVLPDDLMNLRSLVGFLKLSDGFPTARVELQYQNYVTRAQPYLPRTGPTRLKKKHMEQATKAAEETAAAAAKPVSGRRTDAQGGTQGEAGGGGSTLAAGANGASLSQQAEGFEIQNGHPAPGLEGQGNLFAERNDVPDVPAQSSQDDAVEDLHSRTAKDEADAAAASRAYNTSLRGEELEATPKEPVDKTALNAVRNNIIDETDPVRRDVPLAKEPDTDPDIADDSGMEM